jgi:hypothetical protein
MSVEGNKQAILDMFKNLSNGDMQEVVNSFTDDMTFWLIGNGQLSGTMTRPKVDGFFLNMGTLFSNGVTIYIDHIIGEGDYIAAEGRSHADIAGKSYKNYENMYHWSFKLRDGKIEKWREYLDTALLDMVR